MNAPDAVSVGGQNGSPTDRVRATKLPNGLRVLTDEQPERSAVAVSAWVAVGSRDEPDASAGASHFLEHLLFKGTSDRSARDIAVAMDAVGGDMNAFTSNEHTAFYATAPATESAMVLELLLDVLRNPALAARDVDSEREVILEELAAAREDPDDMAAVDLAGCLFPGHALGRETLGTVESVAGITRDEVAAFFDNWYLPANIVLAASGAIRHDEVLDAAARAFAEAPSGRAPVRSSPAPAVRPHSFRERPGELTHLAIGWRCPAAGDPDRHALSLLNHAFGGGPSSILFQEVREERGLTYSVGSDLAQYGDAGSLSVHCATHADKGPEVLRIVSELASAMAAQGMDDATLAHVKGAVRGGVVMAMESIVTRMTRLGVGELVLGRVVPLLEYLEAIEAVTGDDVARVAATVFGATSSTAVVGPVDIVG